MPLGAGPGFCGKSLERRDVRFEKMKGDLMERTAYLLALPKPYRLLSISSCMLGRILVASGPNPGENVEKKSVSVSTLVRSLDGLNKPGTHTHHPSFK